MLENENIGSDYKVSELKEQCNKILEVECPWSVKIDFRKKVYSIYFNSNLGMDDDSLKMFELVIKKCGSLNKKLDIPFIKKAITYLENRSNIDYNEVDKWLNYYDLATLNEEKFLNNKYSDKELFYLKKAKVLQNTNNLIELNNLLEQYKKEKKYNSEINFFIEYHICKLNYKLKDYINANIMFRNLVLSKRDPYILGLPLKYLDYTDECQSFLIILELISTKYIDDYIYDYIYNWFKNMGNKEIFSKISNFYKIENKKIVDIDKQKLKKILQDLILTQDCIQDKVYHGKIFNVTKMGNMFIKHNKESLFVVRKSKDFILRRDTEVDYICVEAYKDTREKVQNALIIKIRRPTMNSQ